jgi:hypothetical protein
MTRACRAEASFSLSFSRLIDQPLHRFLVNEFALLFLFGCTEELSAVGIWGNLSAFSLTPEISFATRCLAERSDARNLPLMSQSRAIPSDSG